MENTKKLKIVADLLKEVEEDTTSSKVEVECKAMRGTIDECRHECLQERIKQIDFEDDMEEAAE